MALGRRIGCLAASAVAGVPPAVLVAVLVGSVPRPAEIPRAVAEGAFEREHGEATRLGLAQISRTDAPLASDAAPAIAPVEVAAGECVALVATAFGFQELRRVSIEDRSAGPAPTLLAEHRVDEGLVGHVQWCADAPTTATFGVELLARDLYRRAEASQGGLRVAVYRGPGARFGGLRGLTRGTLAVGAYRRVPDALLVAEADRRAPTGAQPLGPELAIEPDAARLVPEDATTYRLLHDGARNGSTRAVSPRVSPLPLDAPAAWRPRAAPGLPTSLAVVRAQVATDADPGAQFPLLVVRGEARRALLVVDSARLGAPCAELRFVRMLFGHRARVFRSGATRAAEAPVRAVENEAVDRVCVSDGLVAYVVPPQDHERYRLRVYAAR